MRSAALHGRDILRAFWAGPLANPVHTLRQLARGTGNFPGLPRRHLALYRERMRSEARYRAVPDLLLQTAVRADQRKAARLRARAYKCR